MTTGWRSSSLFQKALHLISKHLVFSPFSLEYRIHSVSMAYDQKPHNKILKVIGVERMLINLCLELELLLIVLFSGSLAF